MPGQWKRKGFIVSNGVVCLSEIHFRAISEQQID